MIITLIQVGKTQDTLIAKSVADYAKRLGRYTRFNIVTVDTPRKAASADPNTAKRAEGEQILKHVPEGAHVVLLDERGDAVTSRQFADRLQMLMNRSTQKLIFVIGGAHGFSDDVYARANAKLALSKMTFPHQLVRLIFAEQLYRAFTILRNEPYHH
jgi:23S rRNA (pseudouridine1915-N3)-methyltransferase